MKRDPAAGIPHPQSSAAAWFFARLRNSAHKAAQSWRDIVTADPCVYCIRHGRHAKRTLEHIVPVSSGGEAHFDNTAGACRRCQVAKGNAALLLFLARRADAGKLPAADCAIFADTGEEPRATYEHLQWLTGCEFVIRTDGRIHAKAGTYRSGVLPFPTHIVQAWSGHGKHSIKKPLGDEILDAASGQSKVGSELTTSRGMHSRPPFYTLDAKGKGGMIRRQCTGDYKIAVIQSKERALLGLRPRQRWPLEILIEQWIGISTDEATRMKPIMTARKVKGERVLVPHPTIRARFPLIEAGLSREACKSWLMANGYAVPPKSACAFCPFHSDSEWRYIRDNDPASWARAVRLDESIRHGLTSKHLTGALFLHPSRKPLADVDLTDHGAKQGNLFENECAGVCGL